MGAYQTQDAMTKHNDHCRLYEHKTFGDRQKSEKHPCSQYFSRTIIEKTQNYVKPCKDELHALKNDPRSESNVKEKANKVLNLARELKLCDNFFSIRFYGSMQPS